VVSSPAVRPLSEIRSCLDVTDDDIRDALAPAHSLSERGPREKTLELVSRMASVAAPDTGVPKLLLVVAHMATHDWVEGELAVKLIGDDELAVLELFVDSGFSRERILGPLHLDTPLFEFQRVLELRPDLVAPLAIVSVSDRRVELETTAELRRNSVPPAYSAVSESLLPLMGDQTRELPQIATLFVDAEGDEDSPEAIPEVMVTESDEDLDALLRPRFKPLSMPPHLQDALAHLKKK
jgi:hypothetical protein